MQAKIWTVAALLLLACAPVAAQAPLQLKIDTRKQFQTIEHFGASDAWAGQFVGNWPDEKRNAIADLLFSSEVNEQGNPRGIGLSMWRFNIGGGSIEQGKASGIGDEWRRAESFMTPSGQLDFSRQSGQQWFLKAAKQREVPYFLGFVNSPPVQLTRTGKAFAKNAVTNIAPEQYEAYASFLLNVIKGVRASTGVSFNYISPVNEPQNDWSDGGQEGSPYQNEDIHDLCVVLNKSFKAAGEPAKIVLGETFEIKYLLLEDDKPGRGNQLNDLFSPGSPNYVGKLEQVDKVIAYHSYLSSSPNARAVAIRKELAARMQQHKPFRNWQSEYCVLGDNEGELKGERRDLGMNTALYVANLMYNDLVHAQVTAWHWWLAISPYDYKDGLVYVDKNNADGNFYSSKLLWAMGNYSRFVRPGMVRVEASLNADGVKASAYTMPGKKDLVVVLVNSLATAQQVSLPVRGSYDHYTTSETMNLQHGKGEGKLLTLPPRSVVTVVSTSSK